MQKLGVVVRTACHVAQVVKRMIRKGVVGVKKTMVDVVTQKNNST